MILQERQSFLLCRHQNAISNNHSIDDKSHHTGSENGTGHDKRTENNSTQDINSSTVNIPFNAELRLRAYQEQRKLIELTQSETVISDLGNKALAIDNSIENQTEMIIKNDEDFYNFPQNINYMLIKVQNNIVQKSDLEYQYLVNVLNNNKNTVEDPQQLQEIMRKEQFYLTRRKPFMQNSEFQSYSQVLNQFSNIVECQQYAQQSIL